MLLVYGINAWSWEKSYNITPYGTEAMHVLRAEKGYIIVGQETDGSVTPVDLDMDWIVSKKKYDFIGKRALYRSDTSRKDRKQLVGLLTTDPSIVLEEGLIWLRLKLLYQCLWLVTLLQVITLQI